MLYTAHKYTVWIELHLVLGCNVVVLSVIDSVYNIGDTHHVVRYNRPKVRPLHSIPYNAYLKIHAKHDSAEFDG